MVEHHDTEVQASAVESGFPLAIRVLYVHIYIYNSLTVKETP